MNRNPCSNQEIHVLFESQFDHVFKLENTLNEPVSYLHDLIIRKVLQNRQSISPIFLCAKKLHYNGVT